MTKNIQKKTTVKSLGKEITIDDLKKMKNVNVLPENYLNEVEKLIFTRIEGKSLRSWEISLNDLKERFTGKELYIYPCYEKKSIFWENENRKFLRAYAE